MAGKGRDSDEIEIAIDTDRDRNWDRDSDIHFPNDQGVAGQPGAGVPVGGRGGWRALRSGRAGAFRSAGVLLSLLILVPLAGCGPRPPFEVQTLADAGLKPLPAEQLEACA